MNQSNCSNLFVNWMFRMWRHQSPPHLCAFLIETQYPVGVFSNDQIEPLLKFLGLGQVASLS